ncbi:hypothetical protein PENSUB_632 [Penicillium subrubescens]|uniref:DEUBAD domain-containing protein n=1 Tax=Penicillium subrubescens TaxID=1316194 RepID=A0A1Q5ULU9_9EURO|nr:hypothetical protein PENSUB_632 [Penicillium subrubescens]
MSSPASSPAPSPQKRNSRKAAPRGKWSEEQLFTSDKSALIDADLVVWPPIPHSGTKQYRVAKLTAYSYHNLQKLLARPEAWDILEEDEKREILALLPADTHPASELPSDDPNTKIPPLPESFVRYSNNWRDGIRQFQLDLENGRFDPEWLRQAEQARRKRENGDFDSFKEREFEKFWGQKQRTRDTAASGESSKVKLTQLIEAGVFLVGDVWRFSYCYGKGQDRLVIDKEVRIHEIGDRKLSFVVPTGQRVFLRSPAVTAERKEESGQNDGACTKGPQEAEVSRIKTPELETLKEESPTKDIPEKVELQPMEGLQETNQSLKVEDAFTETKQEDLVNGEAMEVSANLEAKPRDENGSVQVVIVSPRHDLDAAEKGSKRPTPLPAVEPPAKRKRGRPRKIRPPSPAPEAEFEVEAVAEPEPEPKLELERQSGVQVVIGAGSLPLPRTDILSQIIMPAVNNHDALDLVTNPREAEPEPEENRPPSSLLSSARPISSPPSTLSEPPEGRIDDLMEERNEEPTMESTEELVEKPIEVPTNEPIEEPIHESVEEPIHEPTRELIEAPVEAPVEAPIEEQTPAQIEENVAAQTDEPTEEPTQPPIEAQTTTEEPDEIIVSDISSPMTLVYKILQIDGRRPDGRTANSWKEIRCYRKNQDMGSLFDVRLAWFLKQK